MSRQVFLHTKKEAAERRYCTEDSEDIMGGARLAGYPDLSYVQIFEALEAASDLGHECQAARLARMFLARKNSLQCSPERLGNPLLRILFHAAQEGSEEAQTEALWAINAHQRFTDFYALQEPFILCVRDMCKSADPGLRHLCLRVVLNCAYDTPNRADVLFATAGSLDVSFLQNCFSERNVKLHESRLYIRAAMEAVDAYESMFQFRVQAKTFEAQEGQIEDCVEREEKGKRNASKTHNPEFVDNAYVDATESYLTRTAQATAAAIVQFGLHWMRSQPSIHLASDCLNFFAQHVRLARAEFVKQLGATPQLDFFWPLLSSNESVLNAAACFLRKLCPALSLQDRAALLGAPSVHKALKALFASQKAELADAGFRIALALFDGNAPPFNVLGESLALLNAPSAALQLDYMDFFMDFHHVFCALPGIDGALFRNIQIALRHAVLTLSAEDPQKILEELAQEQARVSAGKRKSKGDKLQDTSTNEQRARRNAAEVIGTIASIIKQHIQADISALDQLRNNYSEIVQLLESVAYLGPAVAELAESVAEPGARQ